MTQIFRPRSNTISKLVILGTVGLVAAVAISAEVYTRSPYVTGVGVHVEQPVPFSHKHHVGGLGLDCRYCHTSVEKSAFAGMPSTETCMTCHSQLWTEAQVLQPVRDSYAQKKPLQWNRVTQLPDYVYFRHDVHVHKGIGCVTCHGHVENMALTHKVRTFLMGDCIGCHQNPAPFLRPREQVFNQKYEPATATATSGGLGEHVGEQLMREYHIDTHRITNNCTTCHR